MATIAAVHRNVSALNLYRELQLTLINKEKEIIALNQQQLREGKRADSKKMTPQYRLESYAIEKQAMNSQPGKWTPDLYLTGAFYSGFFVDFAGETFELNSSDGKTSSLVKKYSAEVFGLTEPSTETLAMQIVWPVLKKRIEAVTRLEVR